ncbi:unnamed protein product [Thlaspi arvense]|uniref:Uncharacterized protein n=1 Tax=Thlaspi arvense TaxID=13288 RepID=A0AAU9RP26_THLAR|nr:unnamed protein product [Thlaspi arvense]
MRRCEELELVFQQEGRVVDDLLSLEKFLRAMPVVDLEMPTLCLIGAPLLVRSLSIGMPEKNSDGSHRFDLPTISDDIYIPRLLRRRDEDRNDLEKLTPIYPPRFYMFMTYLEKITLAVLNHRALKHPNIIRFKEISALDDFKDLNLAQRYEEQDMRNKKKVKEKVVLMISKKKGKEKVILCKICFAMMYVFMIMCVRHIWMINEMIF